jgi:hypothetical protein
LASLKPPEKHFNIQRGRAVLPRRPLFLYGQALKTSDEGKIGAERQLRPTELAYARSYIFIANLSICRFSGGRDIIRPDYMQT